MIVSDHALHFEPTVDELEVLKKLELGESISPESAMRDHLSKRLLERGMAHKDDSGRWALTPIGRDLIRRHDG